MRLGVWPGNRKRKKFPLRGILKSIRVYSSIGRSSDQRLFPRVEASCCQVSAARNRSRTSVESDLKPFYGLTYIMEAFHETKLPLAHWRKMDDRIP